MIRQTLEQGQNKLRYVLELKERVIMNTEPIGAIKIKEDTENLKADFDKLLMEVEETRQKLSARAGVLEDLNKIHRLIIEWLEEVESNISSNEVYKNDLSEKRALLEKYKTVQRDVIAHDDTIEKFKLRVAGDSRASNTPYDAAIARFEKLQNLVAEKIEVN